LVNRIIEVGPSFESSAVAKLVQKASQFKSHISLVVEEKTANAKSIMGIISLNLQSGSRVNVVADGEDAGMAIPALEQIIGN